MFSWFRKPKVTSEALPDLSDWEKNCPDCETPNGQSHDLFCLKERCPFCGGQLATCDCLGEVLELNEEELNAVDECIDDHAEPLKTIMARWRAALDAKGRIPFQSTALTVTPESLILASARGALPFVRKLLAEGVPVNGCNHVRNTALMTAARCGQARIVEFLLEQGADVHLQDQYGHTPLHCAVSSPDGGEVQAECVSLLLRRGSVVDARKPSGSTPLMSAAWFGGRPEVEALLEAGADVFARDEKGRTAWDMAKERGHGELASFLAQKMTG